MNEEIEELGRAIDTVDNLAHGLNLPLHDRIHVESLKELLPEVVVRLKKGFAAVTGQNPWVHQK